MSTDLLYMNDMKKTTCESWISEVTLLGEKQALILNQTVFYPQGGGQPWDLGVIKDSTENFVFEVQEVRFIDGKAYHGGFVKCGIAKVGMPVICFIDWERRLLNARLHSAGHLIDCVIKRLSLSWLPIKGYHFAQGSYVEYEGFYDEFSIEKLKIDIESGCAEVIETKLPVSILFEGTDLKAGKPYRLVCFGDYKVPCGGTHVSSLNEIGKISIKKIKKEKGFIRVSYSLEN